MPSIVATDIRLIMSGLLQDAAGKLTTATRNQAIQSAVQLHSTYVPNIKVSSLTGVSGNQRATPTSWIDDVSVILKIEFPANDKPPTYLEEDEFFLNQSPTGSTKYQIQFTNSVPTTNERFRVFYSIPHKLGATASINTIPDNHQYALANLAASIACSQLAAFYSQTSDSLIQADSVNAQQKNPNYLQLSRQYRKDYFTYFRIDEKDQVKAGGLIGDIDRLTSFGGQDFFYHNKRWR